MLKFIRNHRETLSVALMGLIVFAALNIMMLFYHYDAWTNPKVGFWSAFWNKFEVSGFDPYTYIVISKWRPLYVLSRHPLLALMMWPFAWLNEWLTDVAGINCAIFIVAVMWTFMSTCTWLLMYKIMRRLLEMTVTESMLLTVFFFSISHVLLITFIEDHMSLTLPLLLLTIYLAGKAVKQGRTMPLWQSLPLLFVSTGVTTTNCVKVGIADLCTRWGKTGFWRLCCHYLIYLVPLGIIAAAYFYQQDTTQEEERRSIERTVNKRIQRDEKFAREWAAEEKAKVKRREAQLVHLSIATNTEYHIDRLPSLVDNVFGEGFILHDEYVLRDSNKHNRPVDLKYTKWYYYLFEAIIVLMLIAGIWVGRRDRVLWMALGMFLFDMLLHVGLNFASSDVYIMTAHWAFIVPIAYACLLNSTRHLPKVNMALMSTMLFVALFMLVHNMQLIVHHILG